MSTRPQHGRSNASTDARGPVHPRHAGAAAFVVGTLVATGVAANMAMTHCAGPGENYSDIGGAPLAFSLALTLAGLGHAAVTDRLRNGVLLFALAAVLSWAAESAGLRWGLFFGGVYDYAGGMGPTIGGVPLFVTLGWFVFLCFPVVFLRRWQPPVGNRIARTALKAATGALAPVAVDILLDPLAVSAGLWAWKRPGMYFGVPWLNFFGWYAVSATVLFAYEALRRPSTSHRPGARLMERALVTSGLALFAFVAVCFAWRFDTWRPPVVVALLFVPLHLLRRRSRRRKTAALPLTNENV